MTPLTLAAQLDDLSKEISTGPWMHMACPPGKVGDHWQIADLGCDPDNEADHYVTTNHVHAFDVAECDPRPDAQMIALCRNHLRLIIDALREKGLQESAGHE